MPQILIRAHKNPFAVADADTVPAESHRQQHRQPGLQPGGLPVAVDIRHRPGDVRLARSHPSVINSRFDHVVIPLANAFGPATLTPGRAQQPDRATERPRYRVGRRFTGFTGWRVQGCRSSQPATTRFVRAVLNRSPSIGVRGEQTRDYLKSAWLRR